MSIPSQPSTPERRDRATSRLRFLTRGAVVAATGATVAMGFVVAHEQPGASATRTTTSTSSGGSSSSDGTGSSGSGESGDSGTTGTTGTTGDTGNTGTSTTQPTATSSRPTVTSGGTSR
jgi:hypothetical protein